MNYFCFSGNVGSVEFVESKNHLRFSVAHNYQTGKEDSEGKKIYDTFWVSCLLAGKRAPFWAEQISVGVGVVVSGSFTAKTGLNEDGSERTFLNLFVDGLAVTARPKRPE